jgi:hypothetical protein
MDKLKTVAIIIEGGLVQDIVSDDPAMFRDVDFLVIDYDTEGAEPEDVYDLAQPSGGTATAFVGWRGVTRARIDLDQIKTDKLKHDLEDMSPEDVEPTGEASSTIHCHCGAPVPESAAINGEFCSPACADAAED